jgi:hypothetical protein
MMRTLPINLFINVVFMVYKWGSESSVDLLGASLQEVSPGFNHATINSKEKGVTRIKAHFTKSPCDLDLIFIR